MSSTGGGITIVGLGPGDAHLLTLEARDALASAHEVWLRTSRHPAVEGLPAGPRYESFDDTYERRTSFEDIYESIVAHLMELGSRPEGVVYAVPGNPAFGEATVRAVYRRAGAAGLAVRVVPGLSFLDVTLEALGVDPLAEGLLVLDALALQPRGRGLVPQRPTLIAQVYDRRAATHAKLELLEVYPPEHRVWIARSAGTGSVEVTEALLADLDREERFDHLTSVFVPPLAPLDDARSFEGLRRIVAKLRDPDGGCPWDLQQTHESLKRFLIEEAYEALEALEEGDPHRLAGELGDVLMQVVLHAQVAEDAGGFVIEDVIASIGRKLVRRHPHVFGDVTVDGAEDVVRNWEALKQEERGEQPALDAVPRSLPALAQAQSLTGRAEIAGIDVPLLTHDAAQQTLARLLATKNVTTDELGALLLTIATLARRNDVDAEESLRTALRSLRGAAHEASR